MVPGAPGEVADMALKGRPIDIEKFASRPGVRRIAVENFLDSMPLELGMTANQLNCARDSVAYGWDGPTVTAILDGIWEAYGGMVP
mgnify:CR=1 FL=1